MRSAIAAVGSSVCRTSATNCGMSAAARGSRLSGSSGCASVLAMASSALHSMGVIGVSVSASQPNSQGKTDCVSDFDSSAKGPSSTGSMRSDSAMGVAA